VKKEDDDRDGVHQKKSKANSIAAVQEVALHAVIYLQFKFSCWRTRKSARVLVFCHRCAI